jgi:hypothetical protein
MVICQFTISNIKWYKFVFTAIMKRRAEESSQYGTLSFEHLKAVVVLERPTKR